MENEPGDFVVRYLEPIKGVRSSKYTVWMFPGNNSLKMKEVKRMAKQKLIVAVFNSYQEAETANKEVRYVLLPM